MRVNGQYSLASNYVAKNYVAKAWVLRSQFVGLLSDHWPSVHCLSRNASFRQGFYLVTAIQMYR